MFYAYLAAALSYSKVTPTHKQPFRLCHWCRAQVLPLHNGLLPTLALAAGAPVLPFSVLQLVCGGKDSVPR